MATPAVRVENDGAVRTLVFCRAEEFNTITPQLRDELAAVLDHADRDPGVRVVMLRAEGRAFCAGFGLDWSTTAQATAENADGRAWDSMADVRMIGRYAASAAGGPGGSPPPPMAARARREGRVRPSRPDRRRWRGAVPVDRPDPKPGADRRAYEPDSRLLGCFLDGVARHPQECNDFVQRAQQIGWRDVVRERDAPFGDYGARPRKET